jgi:hypothetical protein
MERAPRYMFYGEDDEDEAPDLRGAPLGTFKRIRQSLFRVSNVDSWEPMGDDHAGLLHGFAFVAGEEHVVCHLVFTIYGEGTLVATGVLPPGPKHIDDGTIAVTGGTGDLSGVSGVCDVRTRNPKRWDIYI